MAGLGLVTWLPTISTDDNSKLRPFSSTSNPGQLLTLCPVHVCVLCVWMCSTSMCAVHSSVHLPGMPYCLSHLVSPYSPFRSQLRCQPEPPAPPGWAKLPSRHLGTLSV